MVSGTIDHSSFKEIEHFIRLSTVVNRGIEFPVPDLGEPTERIAIQIATNVVEWLELKYDELKELAKNKWEQLLKKDISSCRYECST